MSPVEATVLRSVVIPATVSGVALLGTGGLAPKRAAKVQSLVAGAGFSLGAYLLLEHLAIPPADVNESFTYAALLLALFASVAPRATSARYLTRAIFSGLGLALVVWHLRASLNTVVAYRNLGAFFCLTLGAWSLGESNAAGATKASNLIVGFLSILAVSLIALFFGSAVVANLAGTLAGQLGAALALALVFPKRLSVDGILPFATALVALFAAAVHFYMDVNSWYLVASLWPIAALAVVRRMLGVRRPVVEVIFTLPLAAAPVALLLRYLYGIAGPIY